ncbi:MAG: NADH-quinone oxidoreductase subunit B family protein [Solirubrobacteraceae bacterium]
MLAWIYRGLRGGRVSTRYPAPGAAVPPGASDAISVTDGWAPLRARARMLGRSVHVRHIDCGSDGSEEWEILALWNPYYDIQRLGFFLTNSPRHADVLLVTGPVTAPLRAPLERTWELMPAPKALVAVGDDACGIGLYAGDRQAGAGALTAGSSGMNAGDRQAGGGALTAGSSGMDAGERQTGAGALTAGGVAGVLPVDVFVPGSPPAPAAVMQGLLKAVGLG